MAEQSRMHRFEVGDKVSYQDVSDWPPVDMEGEITDFANEEKTYLEITFEDEDVRVLTEDEVKRVG